MTVWHRLLRRRALERELDADLRDHSERDVHATVLSRRCEGVSLARPRPQVVR